MPIDPAAWTPVDIYPHKLADKGQIRFTNGWLEQNDVASVPAYVALRKPTTNAATRRQYILRTTVDDFDTTDLGVNQSTFDAFGDQTAASAPAEFRAAGAAYRLWHRKGARLQLALVAVTFVLAVAAGYVALIGGVRRAVAGVPAWLLIVVFGLVCVGAVINVILGIKKIDE